MLVSLLKVLLGKSDQYFLLIDQQVSLHIYGCKTLEEVWSGNPVSYTHLRIFGCLTYFHVNDGKLEHGARKAIFLGYRMG